MMAVALQQEAALAGRAGGKEPGDRFVASPENAVIAIDRETTFRVYEHGTQRTERDIWPCAEPRPVGDSRVVARDRFRERAGR